MTPPRTLLEWLDTRCTELAERPELRSERHLLLDIAAHATEPLRIAVTGDVSTGKSTLVNALLGKRVAAVQRVETTAEVTWFRRVGLPVPPPLGPSHRNRSIAVPRTSSVTLADTPGVNTVSGNQVHTEEMLAASSGAAGSVSALLYLCLNEVSGEALDRIRAFSSLTSGPLDEGAHIMVCGSKADGIVGADPDRIALHTANLRQQAGRYASHAVAVSPALALASVEDEIDDWLVEQISTIAGSPGLVNAARGGWPELQARAAADAPHLVGQLARLQRLTPEASVGLIGAIEVLAQDPVQPGAAIRRRWREMSGLDALDALLGRLVSHGDVLTVSAVRGRLRRLRTRLGPRLGAPVAQVLDDLFRHPDMELNDRRAAALLLDPDLGAGAHDRRHDIMRHVPSDDRREAADLLRGADNLQLDPASLKRWRRWSVQPGRSTSAQRVASMVVDVARRPVPAVSGKDT